MELEEDELDGFSLSFDFDLENRDNGERVSVMELN